MKTILSNFYLVREFSSLPQENEEITLGYFYKLEEEILGTKDVPKFIIRNDIKYIKFRENYNISLRPLTTSFSFYFFC